MPAGKESKNSNTLAKEADFPLQVALRLDLKPIKIVQKPKKFNRDVLEQYRGFFKKYTLLADLQIKYIYLWK